MKNIQIIILCFLFIIYGCGSYTKKSGDEILISELDEICLKKCDSDDKDCECSPFKFQQSNNVKELPPSPCQSGKCPIVGLAFSSNVKLSDWDIITPKNSKYQFQIINEKEEMIAKSLISESQSGEKIHKFKNTKLDESGKNFLIIEDLLDNQKFYVSIEGFDK